MSNDARRGRPAAARRSELARIVGIGVLAALLVGVARGVVAQETPAGPPPESPVPAPAPMPAPTPPPSGGSRPSVDVSADASVDFPGDI